MIVTEETRDLSDVKVLSSGRLGRKTPIQTKTGNPVYRGCCNELLCHHGENKAFISARLSGNIIEKDSECDCMNLDGLYVTTDTTPPPPQNTQLFELLAAMDAECVKVDGRPIRRLCENGRLSKFWVGVKGQLCCSHGKGAQARKKCGCVLVKPRRRHTVFSKVLIKAE